MLTAVLALVVLLQSQTPAPVVQAAPAPPAEPAPVAAPVESPVEATVVPEAEVEPEAEARTRQVCRYVELPGRRFPVRRCRTVEAED